MNLSIKPLSTTVINNTVHIGGISCHSLAQKYGTPLYIVDEITLRRNCQQFTNVFKKHYPNHQILYAGKAGLNTGILTILNNENVGVDVVSLGELKTALNSRIEPNNILLHGNNKSDEEIKVAIEHGIRIVIDSYDELNQLIKLGKKTKAEINVLIRINPEIEAHTHEFIQTGQKNSKFGVSQEDILPMLKSIKKEKQINFLGIHSHIGSQIFDSKPYLALVKKMVQWIQTINTEVQMPIKQLNLGGGFGIRYVQSDSPEDISTLIKLMIDTLINELNRYGLDHPTIIIEPGRSIIGNAGATLYQVGHTKKAGDTNYLFIDGGMADNIRPLLYQSEHVIEIANNVEAPNQKNYTIAGKFCESGDKIASNIILPEATKKDLLIVYGTGAYNYSMASNYNRYCKPAMILVNNKKAALLVKRETIDFLLLNDSNTVHYEPC